MNVDRDAIKALVLLHGQRKAARMSGLNENTVKSWSKRFGWKQAGKPIRSQTDRTLAKVEPKLQLSPISAIEDHLSDLRSRSTVALARYSAEASEEAMNAEGKLNVARKVRDVAAVHSTLWPSEKESTSILQIGVLIGKDAIATTNQ